MKTFITLSLLFLATTFAKAQSVVGKWHEDHGIMGKHGKRVYYESITIKDSVYVGSVVPLQRRVRYQFTGETENIELYGHEFANAPDTVITGNNFFFRHLFGLNHDFQNPHTWDIKVWYINMMGQPVPELTIWFQGVSIDPNSNLTVAPTFAWPDATGFLQYNVSVNTQYDGSVDSFVHIRATGMTSGMVYEQEQQIEIPNWYVQNMTFTIYPWQAEQICVCIWVTRTDSYNDFSDVTVDVADMYGMECVNFGDMSTAIVGEATLPAFELSPNPTSDLITIKNLDSLRPIEVYDLLGKQVKSFPSNGLKIATYDVSDLAEGMYLFVQVVEGEKKVARFEVKH